MQMGKNYLIFIVIFIVILGLIFTQKQKNVLSPQKIILLGIDGAEWSVINTLIKEGKLLNFEKIKQEGSYGYLISPYSFSPISWTEIATGKTPEKHGIFNYTKNNTTDEFVTSYDVKSKRIWNILSENGKSVGIAYWLITWPPEVVNGFMISDFLNQSDVITYPPNLTNDPNIDEGVVENMYQRMSYLIEKYNPDFFAGVDFFNVHLSEEKFWKYWEHEKFNITDEEEIEKNRKIIVNAYEDSDKFLGYLQSKVGNNVTIFVVSDHGMKAIKIRYINGMEISGHHPPGTHGVMLVVGPHIKQNYEIKNATVYDIAPTILYLCEIPIPKDIDGRVLTEMIKDEYLKTHPIKYSEENSQKHEINKIINETMKEKIEEMLKELGYVK